MNSFYLFRIIKLFILLFKTSAIYIRVLPQDISSTNYYLMSKKLKKKKEASNPLLEY